MSDKLRAADVLENINLIFGIKFSKPVVFHKDDILWLDTSLHFSTNNKSPDITNQEKPLNTKWISP